MREEWRIILLKVITVQEVIFFDCANRNIYCTLASLHKELDTHNMHLCGIGMVRRLPTMKYDQKFDVIHSKLDIAI